MYAIPSVPVKRTPQDETIERVARAIAAAAPHECGQPGEPIDPAYLRMAVAAIAAVPEPPIQFFVFDPVAKSLVPFVPRAI